MTPAPAVLATPGCLDSARYAHTRELIDQAVLNLDMIQPVETIGQDGTIHLHAYLARAALDRLAEEMILHNPCTPGRWAHLAHLIGLTPRQTRQLVTNHTDPPGTPLWDDEQDDN